MKATVQGQKSVIRRYGHEPLIAPLAYFKGATQTAYEGFFDIVILSSTGQQSFDDGLNGLLFTLVFILLCIVAYYLKSREVTIFFLLLAIFILDKYSSLFHYRYLDSKHDTWLKIRENITFFEEFSQKEPVQRDIHLNQSLVSISIEHLDLKGGAFKERLDTVWQVCLHWTNPSSTTVFHSSQSASAAFRKALEISASYPVPKPVTFANSVGEGAHGLGQLSQPEKLFYITRCRNTVKFKNDSPEQWSICSRWCFESYLRTILWVLKIVGFSLFLVVGINLMGELGGIFLQLVKKDSSIDWLAVISSIKNVFLPSQNWTELLEITIISLLILSKQLNYSLEEEIVISKDYFEYYLNKRRVSRIKTADIKNMLLVRGCEPVLLISDHSEVIEIPGLQTPAEFLAFLYRIIESVEYFRPT